MEAKKKSPSAPAAAGAAPQPANGFFNSVFSASPVANAKDTKQTDLYAMLNKQNSKGQNGGGIADGKCQGSPTKGRAAYKDGTQTNHQSRLILARQCITVVGNSMAALHTRKPMNQQEIMRTIQMAPWLPEVIGGKVHFITK